MLSNAIVDGKSFTYNSYYEDINELLLQLYMEIYDTLNYFKIHLFYFRISLNKWQGNTNVVYFLAYLLLTIQ